MVTKKRTLPTGDPAPVTSSQAASEEGNQSLEHIPATSTAVLKVSPVVSSIEKEIGSSNKDMMVSSKKRKVESVARKQDAETESKPKEDDKLQSDSDDDFVTIIVKPLMGKRCEIKLPSDSTIYDLKEAIFVQYDMLPEKQLLLAGRIDLGQFNDEMYLDNILPCDTQNMLLGFTVQLSVSVQSGFATMLEHDPFADYLPEGEDIETDEDLRRLCQKIGQKNNIEDALDAASILGHPSLSIDNMSAFGDVSDLNVFEDEASRYLMVPDRLDALRISNYNSESLSAKLTHIDPALSVALATNIAVDMIPKPSPIDSSLSSTLPSSNRTDETFPNDDELGSLPKTGVCTGNVEGPTRCSKCNAKCRPALRFECRCGNVFCQTHRYYDAHNCTFDIKKHDRDSLRENNPKVCGSRL